MRCASACVHACSWPHAVVVSCALSQSHRQRALPASYVYVLVLTTTNKYPELGEPSLRELVSHMCAKGSLHPSLYASTALYWRLPTCHCTSVPAHLVHSQDNHWSGPCICTSHLYKCQSVEPEPDRLHPPQPYTAGTDDIAPKTCAQCWLKQYG